LGHYKSCLKRIFFLGNFSMANLKIKLALASVGILLSAVVAHRTVVATHLPEDSHSHLRAITVKILSGSDSIGSGTLWQSGNGSSQVITNSHVLLAKKQPFFVQTSDGQIHPANAVTPASWQKLDLAALQFYADRNYPTARVDRRTRPRIGEVVMAAGFPQNMATSIAISQGAITHLLSKPLAEGYQVGYNINVAKGMSGGPLVDQRGVLVGINGLHSQPLWDGGETFADGTVVTEPLLSQIGEASWAIPVERLE
jgi:serine protease Do